jgi:hypothetical protein
VVRPARGRAPAHRRSRARGRAPGGGRGGRAGEHPQRRLARLRAPGCAPLPTAPSTSARSPGGGTPCGPRRRGPPSRPSRKWRCTTRPPGPPPDALVLELGACEVLVSGTVTDQSGQGVGGARVRHVVNWYNGPLAQAGPGAGEPGEDGRRRRLRAVRRRRRPQAARGGGRLRRSHRPGAGGRTPHPARTSGWCRRR